MTFRQRAARLPQVVVPVITAPAAATAATPARLVLSMEGLMAQYRRGQQRTSTALSLDEADRVSVARYVESVELDHKERTARDGTTPTMLAFAHASDMREAFATCRDAEEAAAAGFPFAADCPAHDPVLAQD